MKLNLEDKLVVITGGAGSIGSVTAECFLNEGSRVVIGDSDQQGSEQVVSDLNAKHGGRVFYNHLDLREERSVRAFVQKVVDDHGGVDSIVNNAAVFHFEELERWSSMSPLDQHYAVGLRGPVTLVQECWRISERSRAGSVVNISSVAGHVGEPNAVAYTAIKAAQKGFTLSCAIEMARFGGWAVSISPGHTWTAVHQERAEAQAMSRAEYEDSQPSIQSTMFGRFLEPTEVGRWIALAASPLGKPLTGQDIRVTHGIEPGGFNRSYQTEVREKGS